MIHRYLSTFLLTAAALFAFAGPLSARSPEAEAHPSTTLRWDRWGVAHIDAPDDRALAYALGWAQMEAHANTLLELYGAARGRGAEYWGAEHFDQDVRLHRLGIPRRAGQWFEAQSPTSQKRLRAFAAGMNAWAETHGDRIAAANRPVLPIRAADPLAQLQVAIHWQVVAYAAERRIDDWHRAGSNAVAVGPGRSASGRAMLVIQPHPPWTPGHRFFETHLKAPGVDAYGIASLGLPILSMGFNADLGWAHTFNPVDGMDLYALQRVTLEDGRPGYRFGGGVRAFEVEEVTLYLRGSGNRLRSRTVKIETSIHGPVVGERQEGEQTVALALRIAGLDRPHLVRQYDAMARAGNRREFEAALRQQQMPMLNVVYADRHGEILYLYNGLLPRRTPEDPEFWRGVVDGGPASTVWGPYRPYGDLPRVANPAAGFLRNSNDGPRYATFPPLTATAAGDLAPDRIDLRGQQSMQLLLDDDSLTFDDLEALQASTHSLAADRLLPELLKLVQDAEPGPGKATLQRAAGVLGAWDRRFAATSRGAVLFAEWFADSRRFISSRWTPEAPLTTPSGLRPGPALEALVQASGRVESEWGSQDVAWGDVYRVRHAGLDLPASVGLSEVGAFRVGFFSPDPDGTKTMQGGISWTAVVEFGDRPGARGLLAHGNGTQPGHPGVEAQVRLFSANRLRPIAFEPKDVEAATVRTVELSIPEE
ncbi:MAG: penicillin acylase family protein [Acidobacteriota bacterium]